MGRKNALEFQRVGDDEVVFDFDDLAVKLHVVGDGFVVDIVGLEGYINKNNPRNFTLAEWQQAKRHGLDAKTVKQDLQECWNVSDDKRSFQQALSEKGYMLAKGDRRGFVAVGWQGNAVSLSGVLDLKTRYIKARLGPPSDLPSVEESTEGKTH